MTRRRVKKLTILQKIWKEVAWWTRFRKTKLVISTSWLMRHKMTKSQIRRMWILLRSKLGIWHFHKRSKYSKNKFKLRIKSPIRRIKSHQWYLKPIWPLSSRKVYRKCTIAECLSPSKKASKYSWLKTRRKFFKKWEVTQPRSNLTKLIK